VTTTGGGPADFVVSASQVDVDAVTGGGERGDRLADEHGGAVAAQCKPPAGTAAHRVKLFAMRSATSSKSFAVIPSGTCSPPT
jgi:hypothetical protein